VQTPGQPRLASASKDATVRIWSTNQQTIEMVLSGHKGSVSCIKWGGTGLIYTGSHDKVSQYCDYTANSFGVSCGSL
jgi:ribosome assembly protein 4